MGQRTAFNDFTSAGEFWADGFVIETRQNGTTRMTFLRESPLGHMDIVGSMVMPTAHVQERWPDHAERDQNPEWYEWPTATYPPSKGGH